MVSLVCEILKSLMDPLGYRLGLSQLIFTTDCWKRTKCMISSPADLHIQLVGSALPSATRRVNSSPPPTEIIGYQRCPDDNLFLTLKLGNMKPQTPRKTPTTISLYLTARKLYIILLQQDFEVGY